MNRLTWPDEGTRDQRSPEAWSHAGSNLLLDFHGDPLAAGLVVFSDGNHHMALEASLQAFRERFPAVGAIFYATTPPAPILTLLRNGCLKIGNFVLSVKPHLFISPPHVLDTLVAEGHMSGHRPFVKSRGNVILVARGNPKRIFGVGDLVRPDVRLFLPNPDTEGVSYQGYVQTLRAIAARAGGDVSFLTATRSNAKVRFGTTIHHREAPEAVAAGQADAAIVYYHLALRYVRIFPDTFEMVSPSATGQVPDPDPANVTARTHVGLVGDGGYWGRACRDFLFTPQVAEIYAAHGLDPLPAATGNG